MQHSHIYINAFTHTVLPTGVAQGVVTGIRGLCTGLGPALFGFIFYLFNVDLNDHSAPQKSGIQAVPKNSNLVGEDGNSVHVVGIHSMGVIPSYSWHAITNELLMHIFQPFIPGPPFAVGAILVFCAIIVSTYIPEGLSASLKSPLSKVRPRHPPMRSNSSSSGTSHRLTHHLTSSIVVKQGAKTLSNCDSPSPATSVQAGLPVLWNHE